jgi:hypothetical protein
MILTLFLCFAVLALYSACIIGLFFLTHLLDYSTDFPPSIHFAKLPITIPAICNVILLIIF